MHAAGIVPRRAGTAIRVRGIDEPNENENTWDNAESDNRKGKGRHQTATTALSTYGTLP